MVAAEHIQHARAIKNLHLRVAVRHGQDPAITRHSLLAMDQNLREDASPLALKTVLCLLMVPVIKV